MNERERYTAIRRRNKIRLKDIADYVGCSIALLSKYENGLIISHDKVIKYKQFIEEHSTS